MKKIKKWILLFIVAAIPIAGIWAAKNPKILVEAFVDLGGLKKGDIFPTISGHDVEGTPLSFDLFKGKKYIVMMGKIDCGVCQSSYPTLEKWKERYPDIPFVMVGKGGKEEYAKVKQKHHFQFPILDADEEIQAALKMKVFPVFYVVDQSGKVAKRMNGFNADEFNDLIKKVREL
ncbi:TlpA family protein disulfide reductase [Effusibacillus consociatus]|uniref:TlpA family protein disulfide reductase n=1 Tax=Effusibacillus consociatus TaxID=1117041 RepID=A0ABV9Q0K5_9BACL